MDRTDRILFSVKKQSKTCGVTRVQSEVVRPARFNPRYAHRPWGSFGLLAFTGGTRISRSFCHCSTISVPCVCPSHMLLKPRHDPAFRFGGIQIDFLCWACLFKEMRGLTCPKIFLDYPQVVIKYAVIFIDEGHTGHKRKNSTLSQSA